MTGVNYIKEPKEQKAPDWFLSWAHTFEKKNDERWDHQEAFNAKQEKFNTEVIKRLDKIEVRLDVLENKVDAVMECPTIKKELNKK